MCGRLRRLLKRVAGPNGLYMRALVDTGGNATKALKHRDRRVTEDSYLDPRITDVDSENKKLFTLDDSAA